jgi:hypothetical protein
MLSRLAMKKIVFNRLVSALKPVTGVVTGR